MKVYGLGLPKTGTTTLIKALEILGFTKEDIVVGDYVYFLDRSKFKGKFILTVRESPSIWFNSVNKWAKRPDKQSKKLKNQRLRMYGKRMPEKDLFIDKYLFHNREMVIKFDPLVVCWERHDGWLELCDYLELPIPNVPFPHLNKQT